jgi:sugar phosphate isomerase/epimerase
MPASIYLHSYNYRGYSLERAVRKAKEFGYDGLELWSGHFRADHLREDWAEARRLAQVYGLPIPVFDFSVNAIAEDTAERRRQTDRLKDYVRMARDYGATMLNGSAGTLIIDRHNWAANGSALAREEHYLWAADVLREAAAVAAEVGLTIALETHMNTIHDTARATVRLLDLVGSPVVVANLDPGNLWGTRSAEPIEEAIDLLGPRIGYVHVKNCRRVAYTPVGADYHFWLESGELDYFAIVQQLTERGFRGPYCIEYSGGGDRSVPTERDIRYLRRILTEVGG